MRQNWETHWDTTALIALGHCPPGVGMRGRRVDQSCLIPESSDGWVTGSDLLLRSCAGFQGEQRSKCPHPEAPLKEDRNTVIELSS